MNKPLRKGFKAPTVDSNPSSAASRYLTADDFVNAAGYHSVHPHSEVPDHKNGAIDIAGRLMVTIEEGDAKALVKQGH